LATPEIKNLPMQQKIKQTSTFNFARDETVNERRKKKIINCDMQVFYRRIQKC